MVHRQGVISLWKNALQCDRRQQRTPQGTRQLTKHVEDWYQVARCAAVPGAARSERSASELSNSGGRWLVTRGMLHAPGGRTARRLRPFHRGPTAQPCFCS
jgi:hypothetical protein